MTIKPIITISADEEPRRDIAPGGTIALGVQLNLELREAPDPGEDPRATFQAFLRALPDVRFAAYVHQPGTMQLTLAAPDWLAPIGLVPAGAAPAIEQWLAAPTVRGGQGPVWHAERPAHGTIACEPAALSAGQRLAGSQTWPAPLPQQAGLTRLLALPTVWPPAPARLYIVPFLPAAPAAPPATLDLIAADEAGVQLNQTTKALGDVTLELVPADLRPTTLPLIDPDSGFLKIDEDSFALIDLIRAIRKNAGSLFWLAPQLGVMPPIPDDERGRRLIWRAASTLCSLFDTLFLALAMPDAGDRKGPILGAILAAADATAGDAAPPTAAEEQAFVTAVRTWVQRQSKIGDAPARGAFVDDASKLLDHPAWTGLLGIPEADVARWTPQYLADQPTILPALLRLFTSGIDWPQGVDLAKLEAQVDGELTGLIALIGSEEGFEATILRAFRKIGPLAEAIRALVGGDGARRDAIVDAIAALFASNGDPNGPADQGGTLDAARRAHGSLVADLLLATVPAASSDALRRQLAASNWFLDRLRMAPGVAAGGGVFAPLLDHVPMLTDGERPDLTSWEQPLGAIFAHACADLGALDGDRRRFVADTHPVDIPIRLPIGLGEEAGHFGEAYDGLGLLVKRADQMQWAHVNLTRFRTGGALGPVALLPTQPAPVNGDYQLTHDYKGRAQTMAPPPPAGDADSYPLYFTALSFDDADDDPENDWPAGYAMAAAYAYGTRLDVAAFAISRSGVLPAQVSRPDIAADGHLLPGDRPDPGPWHVGYAVTRTTAIGQTVIERPIPEPKRVDAFMPPRNLIQPLSADYPRQALTATDGAELWIDIQRGADGAGAIVLPARDKERIEIILHDVRALGGTVRLGIEQDPQATGPSGAGLRLPPGTPAAGEPLAIAIERAGPDFILHAGGESQPFSADPDSLAWLRVALQAPAGEAVSLVLADPQGAGAGSPGGTAGAARPWPENLLILRPEVPGWSPAFASTTEVPIAPPSMGLEDFDRWLANADLRTAAAGGHGDLVDLFIHELLAAREDLASSPDDKPDHEYLVKLFERFTGVLPDLAVGELLVELTLVDALDDKAWVKPLVAKRVPVLPLGTMLHRIGYKQGQLEISFANLARLRRIAVRIESGTAKTIELDVTASPFVARIPEGGVARLLVRPVVADGHFAGVTPVITERLRELAVGRLGDGAWLFEGAALTIEVMDDHSAVTTAGLVDLANQGLALEAAPAARHYELTLDPKRNALWRHLATAEIGSQRWRPLGRPIYSWFRPHDHQKGPPRDGCSILRLGGSEAVARFEAEAFESDDTSTADRILEPLGARTILHEGAWEAPSATMFRHRLILRGRYAGARDDPAIRRGWTVVGSDKRPVPARDPWIRVAVLGDRARVQVARPQLRLLMPLNRATDDSVTPPILAMLLEPPFAHGGLADRIGAGTAVSVGYAMKELSETEGEARPDDEEDRQLSIADLRAQIGPDPQLSYRALEHLLAKRVYLESEGPIGLTFDRNNSTAAAFPHSAWTLSPKLLAGGPDKTDWQEHFLGVSMRRYLDPHWLPRIAEVKLAGRTSFAFSETRWIEVRGPALLRCGRDVLKIEQAGLGMNVAIFSQAILPEDAHDSALEMSRLGPDAEAVALLHQPLDKDSAILSVFALHGETMLPRLLGSIEWRAGDSSDGLVELVYDGTGPAPDGLFISTITSASLPTSCEWTRIGRNSAQLLVSAGGSTTSRFYPVAQLSIEKRSKPGGGQTVTAVMADGGAVWLRPSQHDAEAPLYLQRCLALIQTDLAPGQGRDLELFDASKGASLLFGAELKPIQADKTQLTRIVELEMPARPFGSILGLSDDLRTPSFMLNETGQEAAETVVLLIKPFAKARATAGYKLPLMVSALDATLRYQLNLPAKTAAQQIILLQDTSGGRAWYVDQQGALSAAVAGTVTPTTTGPIVTVSVDATQEPWWGDVSVLTLPGKSAAYTSPAELPLSFDWLFGNSDAVLETALTHEALRGLAGAQARIISVSPPLRTVPMG